MNKQTNKQDASLCWVSVSQIYEVGRSGLEAICCLWWISPTVSGSHLPDFAPCPSPSLASFDSALSSPPLPPRQNHDFRDLEGEWRLAHFRMRTGAMHTDSTRAHVTEVSDFSRGNISEGLAKTDVVLEVWQKRKCWRRRRAPPQKQPGSVRSITLSCK